MKLLFDFFPIFLFFLAYKLSDIYMATLIAIGATFLQLLSHRIRKGHYEKTHLISSFIILILGGATLIFQNELFIKWKTTAFYWVLSSLFFGSHFFTQKTVLQHMMDQNIVLQEKIWRHLNLSWGAFFALMGMTNLYVVYFFDTNTWVNFKLFGTLGLTLLFIVLQAVYVSKHIQENGNS